VVWVVFWILYGVLGAACSCFVVRFNILCGALWCWSAWRLGMLVAVREGGHRLAPSSTLPLLHLGVAGSCVRDEVVTLCCHHHHHHAASGCVGVVVKLFLATMMSSMAVTVGLVRVVDKWFLGTVWIVTIVIVRFLIEVVFCVLVGVCGSVGSV